MLLSDSIKTVYNNLSVKGMVKYFLYFYQCCKNKTEWNKSLIMHDWHTLLGFLFFKWGIKIKKISF